jgi:hypothetical protein
MKIRALIVAVAPAILALGLGACGSHAATPSAVAPAATASPALTCHQQYEAWKTGPARTAAKKLDAGLNAVSAAGTTEDLVKMQHGMETAGKAATRLQVTPVPSCADPAGYYRKFLTEVTASGDNASTASGLAAVLVAEGPLKKAEALGNKLAAELKRTAGV